MKTKLFFPALLIAFLALGPIQYAAAQNCVAPPSNMLVWLPGDANPQDILNNAQDLSVNGGVTFAQGKVAQAFTFDGSGDVVYSDINAGTAYTVDFWVRPTDTSSDQALVANRDNSAQNFGNVRIFGTKIQYVAGNVVVLESAPGSVPLNTYTHVALTYDGTTHRLYINGNGAAAATGRAETFHNPVRLGLTVGGGSRFRGGQIDEVEIFTRALADAEIKSIVSADTAGKCKMPVDADGDGIVDGRDACPGTPPGTTVNASGCPVGACLAPPSDMLVWLPGDRNPQDILNNAQDVSVNGAVTFTPGIVGQAFTFDGTGDVLYSNINAGTAYTVDFWVRPGGNTSFDQALVANTDNSAQNFGNLRIFGTKFQYVAGGGVVLESAPGSAPPNTYTHVALTYDGAVHRLYLNGNFSAIGGARPETFNNLVRLGLTVSGGSRFLGGQIDEVEIFKRALTQTEIRGVFYAATAGKCKMPVDSDGDGVVDNRDACPGTVPGTAINDSGCPVGACFPPPAGQTNWFSGNGNANDVKGGANETVSGNVTFTPGKVAQAFTFDGTGDVVYSSINAGNAYTVDFWVKPTSNTSFDQALVANSDSSAQNFGNLRIFGTKFQYLAGGVVVLESAPGSAPSNTYTHVALTYDGAVHRLYLNGNFSAMGGPRTETFNNPVRLGLTVGGGSRFLGGQLDEVEIFNRALSQTEIRGIFNADAAGNCFIGNGVAEKTLGNISTRMPVLTGENVLIGGIIVTGNVPKRVIVRGLGPSLGAAGVSGALADPVLELYQGNTLLFANDNWQDSQGAEITATGVAPANSLEAAIVRTLDPGNYTAVLRGKGNITGVGLVDGYDLNQDPNSKLANISTRGFAGTGDGALIAGFISGPNTRVVVRAIGPSLTNLGINGALQNPTLQLVDANGGVVRSNDDWKTGQRAELEAIGIQPSDDRESALIEVLNAANYTAVVRGTNNTTGVAVVEVYNLQ